MNNITSSAVSESEQGQPVKPPDAATRWRKLLEVHRVSGLPISVFCRERGIGQSSLFAWRRKLTGVGQTFKAVKVMAEPAAPPHGRADDDGAVAQGAIELCLAGQRRLLVHRGFDRCLLVDLIQTLEALS